MTRKYASVTKKPCICVLKKMNLAATPPLVIHILAKRVAGAGCTCLFGVALLWRLLKPTYCMPFSLNVNLERLCAYTKAQGSDL